MPINPLNFGYLIPIHFNIDLMINFINFWVTFTKNQPNFLNCRYYFRNHFLLIVNLITVIGVFTIRYPLKI